jgi:hypothetical protein
MGVEALTPRPFLPAWPLLSVTILILSAAAVFRDEGNATRNRNDGRSMIGA